MKYNKYFIENLKNKVIGDTGYRIQDKGYRIQNTEYRINFIGGRIQNTGLIS